VKPFDRLNRIKALKAPATVKAVLYTLALHSDSKNKSWPGISLIAVESGLSKRSVINVIGKLKKLGYVATIRRGAHSSIYILNLPTMKEVHEMHQTGARGAHRTVQRTRVRRSAATSPPEQPLRCLDCGRDTHQLSDGDRCSRCFKKAYPNVVPFK
jgi:hypothetical protein